MRHMKLQVPVTSTVEMFVMEGPPTVSLDAGDSAAASETPARPPPARQTRQVAPPRAKPLVNSSPDNGHPAAVHTTQSAQTKKLRVELSMAQSELRDKQLEAKQSNATIKYALCTVSHPTGCTM